MAFDPKTISVGKSRKAPRIILLGPDKVGKSTFAAGAPDPIFIQVRGETGLDEIDAPKMGIAETYSQVVERMEWLATADHKYRTLVIDSASAVEPLLWQHVCEAEKAESIEKVGGGYGKGYIAAGQVWRDLSFALDYLRENRAMQVILIGHVKAKIFNDPLIDPYDSWVWTINDRASAFLYAWADCTLFATEKTYTKTIKGKGGAEVKHATGGVEKVLYTEKRPGHPGGNRYGLPYELPLDYSKFQAALDATAATK